MKSSAYHPCLILAIGLLFASGCSLSRGNLASKSEAESGTAEQLDNDKDALVKSAVGESTDAGADGPPSQPGAKSGGGSRKKLAGWLKKSEPKRASIPLDRTDSEKESEESVADEGPGFWKHSDAPMTADSQSAKSQKSSLDSPNPFEP